MTSFFDIVYRDRAISAPVDMNREFFSYDVGGIDAPQLIAAGSTESNDGDGTPFHTTSYHFRKGY